MKALLLVFTIGSLLLGCGQKGDLYHTVNVPPPEIKQPTTK